MKFLLPIGGDIPPDFGVLTTPSHKGIPAGIIAGRQWAGDNEAYTRTFDLDRYLAWLKTMEPYRDTCLFISVPDVVGDASATLRNFEKYADQLSAWPLAFVAQDGQEDLPFPGGNWTTLFIGGTTEWKLSEAAVTCILRAQSLGKRIHIGRVNYQKRYQLFASLPGSEDFTCDGTRQRFDGIERTKHAWRKYMQSARQPYLPY